MPKLQFIGSNIQKNNQSREIVTSQRNTAINIASTKNRFGSQLETPIVSVAPSSKKASNECKSQPYDSSHQCSTKRMFGFQCREETKALSSKKASKESKSQPCASSEQCPNKGMFGLHCTEENKGTVIYSTDVCISHLFYHSNITLNLNGWWNTKIRKKKKRVSIFDTVPN